MADTKRKLTSLNIDQKLAILNCIKLSGKTRKEVAQEYSCDLSTISRILQQEAKIRELALKNGNTSRKRIRKGNYDAVDQAVSVWFRQMRNKGAVISGPMILEQAKQFANLLDFPHFEPSNGWLSRWKSKENISFHRVQGEKSTANKDGAADWKKNVLPALLNDYEERDIFNADESGLFYKALPQGTLATKGDKIEGSKTEKDRLTLLFICNMAGTEKRVFCIGRSKNPRCFRGKNIPIPYYSNTKSWMTSALWSKILLQLDEELAKEGRNILLFADNAACHKLEDGIKLNHINITFLPPNTTSIIQPLDQGIIRSFKVYYRQQIVRKQLLYLEKESSLSQFSKTINVWEASLMIKHSWEHVTAETIKNCYRKAFSYSSDEDAIEEKSPVIDLEIPEEDFDRFVKIDDNLECYGDLNNEEIIQEIRSNDNESDSTQEDTPQENGIKNIPARKEAAAAITLLQDYFKLNHLDMGNLDAVENQFIRFSSEHSCVQKKLTDFFN